MRRQPTVFILGAGASSAYGYPLGFELRARICRNFALEIESMLRGPNAILLARDRPLIDTAQRFCDVFKDSNTPSIDLFLSRNVGFENVGKYSIVLNILAAEARSKFGIDLDNSADDWVSYLYERMTDDLIDLSSFGRFSENKTRFITFNYDRSLEHFLFTSLRHSFNDASDEDIEEQVKKIRIDHVYGSVGPLPWQGDGRQYSSGYGWNDIKNLAKSIKLMHQERESA